MGIAAFAETLANNLSTCYGWYFTDEHLILASVLDPSFKAEWIMRDESVCKKLREILLIEETRKGETPVANTPSAAMLDPEPELKKARLFGSCFADQQCIPGDAKPEIEIYPSSPRQNPDAEVIQYRKENTKLFPSGQK